MSLPKAWSWDRWSFRSLLTQAVLWFYVSMKSVCLPCPLWADDAWSTPRVVQVALLITVLNYWVWIWGNVERETRAGHHSGDWIWSFCSQLNKNHQVVKAAGESAPSLADMGCFFSCSQGNSDAWQLQSSWILDPLLQATACQSHVAQEELQYLFSAAVEMQSYCGEAIFCHLEIHHFISFFSGIFRVFFFPLGIESFL